MQGCYEEAENTLQSALAMAFDGLNVISCTVAEMGIASEIYLEIATYQTGPFRYTAAIASLNSQYTIIEKLQKEYVVLLEIIIDLPIGFPINNIILSLCCTAWPRFVKFTRFYMVRHACWWVVMNQYSCVHE